MVQYSSGTKARISFDDQLGGHGLHASGGQSAADGLPQVGRQFIADDTVEDAARLLGVDEVHVQCARLLDGGLDHRLGDLVEGHALHLLGRDAERDSQMPRNGLSLAVRVRCEEDLSGGLGFLLDLLDQLALAADVDIVRLEMVVDIYPQLLGIEAVEGMLGIDEGSDATLLL